MNYPIRKSEIVRWASENISARSELPALIRCLIHATASGIQKIDFPAYESINRSGFDGDLLCDQGDAWVPIGQSKWELSVQKQVGAKANSDYTKRTSETPDNVRRKSTFVLLTAQHWNNKSSWLEEKIAANEWQAVRAYDADDLEQWIEQAPAATAWFSERLNHPIGEFSGHSSKWKALSSSTTPSLSYGVFLASRKRSVARVEKWLTEPPSYLGVISPFPEDAMDFACAVIESAEAALKELVSSQLVYVETHRAFRDLQRRGGLSSLIVDPQVPLTQADISEAIEQGIRILRALPPCDPTSDTVLRLERVREHEVAKELEECEMPTAVAHQKAHDCGGSTTLLKKALARFTSSEAAPSVPDSKRGTLRACLLLGGWDGRNATDRKIVEELSGKSYDDVEIDCVAWSRMRNPLLFSAEGKWRLVSKGDAWQKLSSQLPASAFESARPLVIAILTDADLAYDLQGKTDWLTSSMGASPYSDTIKRHLSETLAFLGAFGDQITTPGSNSVIAYTRCVTSEVVIDAPCTRWASLGNLLSLLAEASPETYLTAIETDLAQDVPQLAGLFATHGSHRLISGCDYAGLLWSLETLAWSPKYLPRVCVVLIKLNCFHIPSNYSNSPMASLTQFLSCGIPYTTASVEQRIAIVNKLIDFDEENSWTLLMSLLGQFGSYCFQISKPDWQGWASAWEIGMPYADLYQQLDAVSDAVIANVGHSAERWCKLFDNLTSMPRAYRERAFAAVATLSVDGLLTDSEKRILCKRIDDFESLHRYHLKASNKLTAKDLDTLIEDAKALQPVSLPMRHAYLFESWVNRHYIRNSDVEDADQELRDDRLKAIREILEVNGLEGILKLASHCSQSFFVGSLFFEITHDKHTRDIIPECITEDNWSLNFVLGFVSQGCTDSGLSWISKQLGYCGNINQIAWVLSMCPFEHATWDLVDNQDDEAKLLYWSRAHHWGVTRDVSSIKRCSSQLIAVGRIAHAVDVVCAALYSKKSLPLDVLLAPLEGILAADNEQIVRQLGEITDYEVGMLITAAQNATDTSEERLFAIECNFLHQLGNDNKGTPATLFRRLAGDPEFFVELLALVCKSTMTEYNGLLSCVEFESRRVSAQVASDLLYKWNEIPGESNENAIHLELLREWVTVARQRATERGHLDACDRQLGQLLANAPADPDGLWPCSGVRKVLEEIATKRIGSGFSLAVINSRGVVCRGEGGEQERELVAKYERLAEQVRIESPFVSSILDDIAQAYIYESKYWDASEEWDR